MEASASSSRELTYAPAPRRKRRRGILLSLVVAMGVAGLISSRQRIHEVLARAQLLHAMGKCAGHRIERGTVVYDEGPYDASLKVPELYWRPVKVGAPAAWKSVGEMVAGRPSFPEATILVHGVKNSKGDEFILHVGRSWQGYEVTPLVLTYRLVNRPGWRGAVTVSNGTVTVLREDVRGVAPLIIEPSRSKLKIFAGQADPQDRTKFIIPIEIDGQAETICGEVTDYGTIHLVAPSPGASEPRGKGYRGLGSLGQ